MSGRAERPDRADWPEDRRGPVAGFSVTVPRLALGTRRLGFAGRQSPVAGSRALLVPVLADRRQWRRPALLIRVVQLLAGVALLLLAPGSRPLVLVLMLAGLFGAVVSPSRTGQAIALAAGVVGWIWGYGPHGSPPVLRVLAFALALFVLHDATSLASTVPLTADLRPEALSGWLRRSAVALLVAGVLIAVVYGAGALVSFHTSYPLELAGLFGVIAVLGTGAWLFSRSLR
jgi:hypothetical protein